MSDEAKREQVERKSLESSGQQDWHKDMVAHYQRTGSFRPEDLRRVLGDPSKGVQIRPDTTMDSFFSQ
jgi:hypothetical protein